ncbi:MAG: hypothetical protein ABI644_11130 [Arenimonas sp.]
MSIRNALIGLVTILYPLAIYFSLGKIEPRWIALILLSVAVMRALASPEKFWRYAAGAALVLALLSVYLNHATPLKLYPVIVSATLLSVFAISLWHPPSVIERLARLQDPNLPVQAIAYTKKVTVVWCFFFLVNGGIAFFTALYASDKIWALYNGLISYCLMGILFAGEWLVRPKHKADADNG